MALGLARKCESDTPAKKALGKFWRELFRGGGLLVDIVTEVGRLLELDSEQLRFLEDIYREQGIDAVKMICRDAIELKRKKMLQEDSSD